MKGKMAALAVAVDLLSTHDMTLAEVLRGALETSSAIRIARAHLQVVKEKVPQARAAFLPSITFSATAGLAHQESNAQGAVNAAGALTSGSQLPGQLPQSSIALSVNQFLYKGGGPTAQLRQARLLVLAEQENVVDVEAQALLRAVVGYSDVVLAAGALSLSRSRLEETDKRLEQAQGRFDLGDLSRSDLASVEASRAEEVAENGDLIEKLDLARAKLYRDTGISVSAPASNLEIPFILPADLRAAKEDCKTVPPKIHELRLEVEAARQSVQIAEAQARPSLGIAGVLQQQRGGSFPGERDSAAGILLQLKAPIYTGGLIESQAREAKATLEEKLAELADAQLASCSLVLGAWTQQGNAEGKIVTLRSEVAVNEVILEGTNRQFAAGERTNADLANATSALFDSRSKLLSAQHDRVVAKATLAATLGTIRKSQELLATEEVRRAGEVPSS